MIVIFQQVKLKLCKNMNKILTVTFHIILEAFPLQQCTDLKLRPNDQRKLPISLTFQRF